MQAKSDLLWVDRQHQQYIWFCENGSTLASYFRSWPCCLNERSKLISNTTSSIKWIPGAPSGPKSRLSVRLKGKISRNHDLTLRPEPIRPYTGCCLHCLVSVQYSTQCINNTIQYTEHQHRSRKCYPVKGSHAYYYSSKCQFSGFKSAKNSCLKAQKKPIDIPVSVRLSTTHA